jgi:hypothetical protein
MQMLDLRAYNLTVSKVCNLNLQSAISNLQSLGLQHSMDGDTR